MGQIEINPQSIDWESKNSILLLNDRWPLRWQVRLSEVSLPHYPGHIWLASSGSYSSESKKLVALSKEAILCSAQSVNSWVQADSRDCWLNFLPIFHIGGLSVIARSFLTKSKVIQADPLNWSPTQFLKLIESNNVSLTSLVPTQVYDLVSNQLVAPKSLRAIFVGGGHLSKELYENGRKLGWPLLPTYGMTECSSQIATAPLSSLTDNYDSPEALRLPHIKWGTNSQEVLCLESKALFTAIAEVSFNHISVTERNFNQAYVTDDQVKLEGEKLKFIGRKGDLLKVSGELVNLRELNKVLEGIGVHGSACVIAVPHSRRENEIRLVVEDEFHGQAQEWLTDYNKKVAPYEKAQSIDSVSSIPRSELGKVLWGELRHQLQENNH